MEGFRRSMSESAGATFAFVQWSKGTISDLQDQLAVKDRSLVAMDKQLNAQQSVCFDFISLLCLSDGDRILRGAPLCSEFRKQKFNDSALR